MTKASQEYGVSSHKDTWLYPSLQYEGSAQILYSDILQILISVGYLRGTSCNAYAMMVILVVGKAACSCGVSEADGQG